MAKKTAKESILREKTVKSAKVKVNSDSRFKSLKSMSILSVVLVIAICIVGNAILSLTLDKTLTFDTSSVKSNTVSQFTRNYLKDLNKTVEIIGLFDRNDESLEWRDYFVPIVDDYEAKGNGKIELRYVDPDVDPFILTQLDPEGIYNLQKNMYVIRCDDLLEVIQPYSCFGYDQDFLYYYGYGMPVVNNVELEFTSSIVYVSSDRPLHAYYLSGHNLPSHNSMDTILKSLGFTVSELSLSGESAEIPSDCELLLILEPKSDLAPIEKELIKTYLDNSGKVILVSDFDADDSVSYTNLNDLTKKMGVGLENGIIHENDISCLPNADDPYSSIAVVDSSYAEYIAIPPNYSIQNCRYLKVYADRGNSVFVSPLVITSDSASVDFKDVLIDVSASAGTYPVVLQSVDNSGTEASCMIVIGTSSFTSDEYYATKTMNDNNADFMRVVINDICPVQMNVLVPSKRVPSYVLGKPLSSSSATVWSVIVMTVIPVGCLICGGFIYRRRRHL